MKKILDDIYDSVAGEVAQISEEFQLFSAQFGADFEDFFKPLGIDYFSKLSREQIREDKAALAEFANNFYWASSLTDLEAKQNLEDGIVEIVGEGGGHTSNGLLITRNGYIITSHHCVDSLHKDRLFVRTNAGGFYRVAKVVYASKGSDIALVRVAMSGPAEAIRYRFAPRYDIAQTFPVAHLSRWELKLKKTYGTVRDPKLRSVKPSGVDHVFHNQISMHIRLVRGDSGGIIVTDKSEIYGVAATGNSKGVDNGSCTFWFEAVGIINALVNYKDKKK